MATTYAEYKCSLCNLVITVTGNKVFCGPDRHETGPCSGSISQNKDHFWNRLRTYER
jgi:hypothetical protein